MSRARFEWSEDDFAKAKGLWAEGASATVIGRVFRVSRNAVLGLAHRHRKDFPARRDGANPSGKVRRAPVRTEGAAMKAGVAKGPRVSRPVADRVDASVGRPKRRALPEGRADWMDAGEPVARGERVFHDLSRYRREDVAPVAFVDLARGQCHFPLSPFDEKCGPSTPCCGAPASEGRYCAAHFRLSVRRVGG